MSQYQPEKGTESYVHVRVTKKQGQALPEPKIELYQPAMVAGVLGLTGFVGDIIYDPRTAAQKHQAAPPADTVKAAEPLSDSDSYRARYRTLFHEDAPFNLTGDEVKVIVDRAEVQLANLVKGIDPVAVEVVQNEPATPSKAPTDKAGWYALFKQEFPDDTTEYKDITVDQIREKLDK
jgi:hypothetical protein